MATNALLNVPSNLESPLMYEVSEHPGSSGTSSADSSSSSLGSSITACKKVLCSETPLESTDYWLKNQRALCRIDFVEDKSESHCPSICFVNLAVDKEDYSNDKLRKMLVGVSPDLPRLINCMNVQQPKENEIVLLSGLSSGTLPVGFEVPQCPWLADVCLVQCARSRRNNSANCIIFEINKFLIGLELVQEKQLNLEANILKPEDDTNCSVSSIEEDFLTASEHLEDENEEEIKNDHPEPTPRSKSKVPEAKGKRGRLPLSSEENYLSKSHVASCETSRSSDETLVETTLGSTQEYHPGGKGSSSVSANSVEKPEFVIENTPHVQAAEFTSIRIKDAGQAVAGENCQADTSQSAEDGRLQAGAVNDQATAGQYATNLAESVLQDAFMRLSQSESTFTEEAAVCISAGDTLPPVGNPKEDLATASRPWQELPKIVIVQSPDSYENSSEWPGPNLPPWHEQESAVDAPDMVSEDGNTNHQSTLEVALACAAAVVGTITSPHAAEQIKLEQEIMDLSSAIRDEQELQTKSSQDSDDEADMDYSLPSAICGMTQVASAVAVCGLDEKTDTKYPATASGLLAVADATAAITLRCSIAVGSSMENVNDSVAQVLLKEASLLLNTPNIYKNVGDFIESMNGRIIESVSSPKISYFDDVSKDHVAQSISNAIIKHSIEEFNKKQRVLNPSAETKSEVTTQGIYMETANELLFNVIYSTCKKMSNVVLSDELFPVLLEDKYKMESIDKADDQQMELTAGALSQTQYNYLRNHNELKQPRTTKMAQQENGRSEITEFTALQAEEYCDNLSRQNSLTMKSSTNKCYSIGEGYKVQNKKSQERRSFFAKGSAFTGNECRYGGQEQIYFDTTGSMESPEKQKYDAFMNNDVQVSVSLLSNNALSKYPAQPVLQITHSTDYYCVADFAEELAETVVSMATEIAAICLENSNGKQPWFCSWARGSDYLMPQNLTGRNMKRKKETPSNGSVIRRHRPPRLSEIKRKTDEHPELKERLMNRVVDDSINLEDGLDSVNIFANEVASKIMNLTELSAADSALQGQNNPRNRLHCERWSRGKASSYESIPEEDSDSRCYVNTLGPMSILGQPFSRTSSVSKQSSCESITDEFSRFMVNQMENEGREFDLLLDYYAGRNANNILHSALQQVTRKNGHLNVRPTCLSKQSSTESITDEFYRFMLQEVDIENIDSLSIRNAREWSSSLLPPSTRTPLSFRQSSMPDSRSSNTRLTVNAPVKANSLDGGSQKSSRDFLSVQPVSSGPSSSLCKSDSCLYQRCKNDQITDMLIHETWKNSIEDLMRKNKIIVDNTDISDSEDAANGSPHHVERYANKLAEDIVQSGKSLIMVHQDSFDYTNKESENRCDQAICQSHAQPLPNRRGADTKKGHCTVNVSRSAYRSSLPTSTREVPLIQIEAEQKEVPDVVPMGLSSLCSTAGKTKEKANKEKRSEMNCEKSIGTSPFTNHSHRSRTTLNPELSAEQRTMDDPPAHPGSSDESTGSWSQLVNDEDNPDDTSSYLQLSERSISNGNSSTSSSLGMIDMEVYQENLPPCTVINSSLEEKKCIKDQPDNQDECTSGLSVGTASCHKDVLLINYDLEPDCADAELRTALQWIAASELGIPTIYFKKSLENQTEKFLDVVRLVHQKSWKVGDVFQAVVQFCAMQGKNREQAPSLFDWLLELG